MRGWWGERRNCHLEGLIVNYYEHHLGDFMRDTAHLTMVEECAYRRMLDSYYIRERSLPRDVRDCCKLARATTKLERDAVAYVLREFFELREDGYHQGRADREIARFSDKRTKAKASAEARWNVSERNANAPPNAMRTHSGRNAGGMHRAPVPSPQTPDTIQNQERGSSSPLSRAPTRETGPENPESGPPDHPPTAAGLACRAVKAAGVVDVNPGHPGLLRLLGAGVTISELASTAAELAGKGKAKFALLLATVEGRRADAAAAGAVPAPPSVQPVNADVLRSDEYLRQQAEHARESVPPPPHVLAALRAVVRTA